MLDTQVICQYNARHRDHVYMALNRRHKAILFITLVSTGCALLLGAETRESLGLMLLGVAFAWAIGSDAALKLYIALKSAPGRVYPWIRPLLVMALAGALIGALMLYSLGNPVAVIAASCFLGIFGAPFVQLPTQRVWLRVPIALLATTLFVLATALIIETDTIANYKYGGRFGELTVVSLLAMGSGIFWLSKGWRVIVRGITAETSVEGLPSTSHSKLRTWPSYASAFTGLGLLTFWLSVISWSASSQWAYAPEKLSNPGPNNNLLFQVGFVILLARWPYASWKTILDREPNSEARYLKWHKRVTAVAGMFFTLLLSVATTLGIQNGNDRILTDQIAGVMKDLGTTGAKIGAIKQRDMQTTGDYVQAFSEVETLLPEFEAEVSRYNQVVEEMKKRDADRGIINIQRLYKTHGPEFQKNLNEQIDVVKAILQVTKDEVATARQMSALPAPYQPDFWKENFRPLLVKEGTLREKALALDAEHKSLMK